MQTMMTPDEKRTVQQLLAAFRDSVEWIGEAETTVRDLLRQMKLGTPPHEVDFGRHEQAVKESERQLHTWRSLADRIAIELDCEYRRPSQGEAEK